MKNKKNRVFLILFSIFLIFILCNSKNIDLKDLKNRYTLIKEKILELKKSGYDINDFIIINTQIQDANKEKNYEEVLKLIKKAEKMLEMINKNEKSTENS